MKKLLILIFGLSLTAASCNVIDLVTGNNPGARGVFRSEDNGETFRAINKVGQKGSIANLSVTSLAFDPSNPETLYIGSAGGVYKSEDRGDSWRYILSGIAVADIAVDPYKSEVLYAAGIASGNGKIIKSIDGGTSWVDIYTEPSSNNAVLSIAVSSFNAGVIMAGLNGGELIRSSDNGHTWQGVKDTADKIMRIRFASGGNAYALSARFGVWRSTNAGATWTQMVTNLGNISYNSAPSQNISSVTGFYDVGLDARQAGVLYLGTEQGLFRSVDNGANWSFVNLPVRNSSLKVSSIAVSPSNSNHLYAAVGGIIFKSLNGGVTWETKVLPTNSEVRMIIINPQSTNTIYVGLGAPRNSQ